MFLTGIPAVTELPLAAFRAVKDEIRAWSGVGEYVCWLYEAVLHESKINKPEKRRRKGFMVLWKALNGKRK